MKNNQYIQVAVVAAYHHQFKLWVKENKKPNERYIPIYRKEDCKGYRFDRIEYVSGWTSMRDVLDIEEYIKPCLIK